MAGALLARSRRRLVVAVSGTITDNFTRTSTTSPGSASNGTAWVTDTGTYGTDGSTLGSVSRVDDDRVGIDTGVLAQDVTVTLTAGAATANAYPAILLRYLDYQTHYLVEIQPNGGINIVRRSDYATLGTVAAGTVANGAVIRATITAALTSPVITVYVGGTQRAQVTATGSAPNSTRVGFRHGAAASNLSIRWDNFTAVSTGATVSAGTATGPAAGSGSKIVAPSTFTVTPAATSLVYDWDDVPAPNNDFGRYEYRIGTTSPPTGSPVSTGYTSGATVPNLVAGTGYYLQARSVTTTEVLGDWSAVQGPHVPLAAAQSGSTAADATLLPFADSSPWRLGVANDATFAGTSDSRNVAIRNTGADGSGQVWVNEENYSHAISYASASDPLATMTDTVHTSANDIPSGGSWQERIPANAKIADGTDRHMAIITPDRSKVQEHFDTRRQSSTAYTCGRRHEVSLTGTGMGPQNGSRAYGGSSIGGLIRAWEVDPSHPSYTGVIRHPLAIALRPDQLYFDSARWTDGYGYYNGGTVDTAKRPGWPAGTSQYGFMKQTGYIWPATEQDYDSPNSYTGAIPMGSYFAIPPTVDVTALGLTPQGLMLAKAAQDYGCYVTDRSGSSSFYVENDAAGKGHAYMIALVTSGGGYNARDPRIVFNNLRVVTNNGPSTPNGAAIGAARRA